MPTKEEIQARYLRGEINKTTYDELLDRLRVYGYEQEEALKRDTLKRLSEGFSLSQHEAWSKLPEETKQQYRNRNSDLNDLNNVKGRLFNGAKKDDKKALQAQADVLETKLKGYGLSNQFHGMR